jgi:alkanesulfonate monooxygenase SsuD/methylene tetrahydromethanopterin reductase-like flavin-dependent oxidoreductase (luciferase family)
MQSGEEVRADIEDRFVLGSPAECADALGALEADLGMTDFVFKPHWPGLPHREAMAQLETFGADVVPKLLG